MRWTSQSHRSCASCARGISASLHVIASIEDPAVIEHILKHLKQKDAVTQQASSYTQPPERAPPESGLFDPSQTRLFD